MSMDAATLPPKMLVRIHPFNPARGFVRKTFIVHGLGTVFTEKSGWYELDTSIAIQLAKFRNNDQDPQSPKVFQIVTQDQALRIDQRGVQKAAEAKSPIRVASNPLQNRTEIPKPVVLPKAEAPAAPIASVPPAAPVSSAVTDEFDDAFDGNGLDGDMGVGISGGDLTTAELVGTATRPKKALEDDDSEVTGAAIPPPVVIPEAVKAAVAAKAAVKKKR